MQELWKAACQLPESKRGPDNHEDRRQLSAVNWCFWQKLVYNWQVFFIISSR